MNKPDRPIAPPLSSKQPHLPDAAVWALGAREKARRIAWLYLLAATCQLAITLWAWTEWLNWRLNLSESEKLGIWITWGLGLIPYLFRPACLFVAMAYGVISAVTLTVTAGALYRFKKPKSLKLISALSCLLAPAGTLVGIYSIHFIHTIHGRTHKDVQQGKL
ncbi:hypothetical protein [Xanthomonas hortorum]|uniref:hypothetical protein n=1 Tax=Xanthomonas hortorum TaxID=56454 RepID=UPI0011128FA1|nr:hypothetical protein [Xanthomonas hortorum]MCC4623975.1 hypothetical protein [Xanthomonas campestris pv. nigromaculans]MCC8497919.1 hypothetical protein [Xanthomonas hortorum pv. gardneri]MCC8507106.1 hypothetical protein [Xanthomonas hortorum pv. gardneri]MCC8511502.1 hypothetical protein [Xanthomonas hortorum pv. gardneri]MCC8519806.1 hypothetical protein [Xanthomonas hortorum pv. gardneri]